MVLGANSCKFFALDLFVFVVYHMLMVMTYCMYCFYSFSLQDIDEALQTVNVLQKTLEEKVKFVF
jgi:hypothetical protein